jgi:GTPase
VEQSSKILTFIDVAGNIKYKSTMIGGICMHNPDYALIVIDPISGITPTTKEHFQISFAYGVPVIIVITKTDLISEEHLDDFHTKVNELHKLFRKDETPYVVSNE